MDFEGAIQFDAMDKTLRPLPFTIPNSRFSVYHHPMPTSLTTIIFDFGGVLIEWDPRNLYRRYFDTPQAMEAFLSEVDFNAWNTCQDKGRPFAEGVAELSGKFPQHARLIHAFQEHWEESVGEPIPATIEIMKKLKQAGWRVYGLSNWSAETFPITRRKHNFFDLLDGYLISGEVKLVKPDPAIFQVMLDKIGCTAQECLFIDDNLSNIESARRLGIPSIHFQSPAQLEMDLKALNIL
jgi:2-haloacid dehalogenase